MDDELKIKKQANIMGHVSYKDINSSISKKMSHDI